MEPKADEFALFTFDRDLRQETPFTNDPATIKTALDKMTAIGVTSLYDAIADTAKKLSNRPSPRRAVVVITDGIDNASQLTAADAAVQPTGVLLKLSACSAVLDG